jgi:hypothetical protein
MKQENDEAMRRWNQANKVLYGDSSKDLSQGNRYYSNPKLWIGNRDPLGAIALTLFLLIFAVAAVFHWQTALWLRLLVLLLMAALGLFMVVLLSFRLLRRRS